MTDILRPSLRLRPNEQRGVLLLGDLIVSTASMFGAIFTWYRYTLYLYILEHPAISVERATRLFRIDGTFFTRVPWWFYLLPLIWLLLMIEIYEPHAAANWRRTLRGVAIAALMGLMGYSLVFIISQDPADLPRIGVGAFLVIASFLTLGWRAIYIRINTSSGLMRRVLVVGAGKAGHTLADVYCKLNPPPFIFAGFVDDDPRKRNKVYRGFPVVGTSENLLNIMENQRISDIVIAINGEIKGTTFQSILDAQEHGIEVTRMPILYEEMTGRVPVHHLESDWVIRSFVDQVRSSAVYEFFKRFMDIVGGLLGLVAFIIIFPFAALAILIDSGWPIFYSQTRLGKGGTIFRIYKFRTMIKDAESDGDIRPATEDDPRVTRVGNFLRRTRLDEMPQFLGVLRGEMSLVGPRAERPELVAAYQKQVPFYRARLLVKPGLTGWAQINYGYVASVTETTIKLEYDLYYIKHRTLAMDFSIVLRTIGTVIRRSGR
jgi:exopolysaccharide biosynthesis polyprenyl glycosylphosphotransferase